MKVVAVVPAAGRGARMNHRVPKQYLPLGGKPIVARTIMALQSFPAIDEILVAVREDERTYCEKEIIGKYDLSRVRRLVEGGESRQESVYNALEQIEGDADFVAIHDGVRPFITEDILMEALAQASIHKAAIVAVPITDTVKVTKQHGFIGKTLPREKLWAIQTPQIFDYELILEAHRKAREEKFTGTDDASLVERIGHPVKVVEGSPQNIKITTPEDLIMGEAIFREFGK